MNSYPEEFIIWLSNNSYTYQNIYEKYTMDKCDHTFTPDYDTFICSKWCNEPIDEIMGCNDNTEMEWIMANSFTIEELFEKYIKTL
jgi:hypothetical protein